MGDNLNGYLKLYCAIKGIRVRCACYKCGDVSVEKKLLKSWHHIQYLCDKCRRRKYRERRHKNYIANPEYFKAYSKKRAKLNPQANCAHALANYLYPNAELCQVDGCEDWGHRHHPDYSKPKEIIWLCPLHHRYLHNDKLALDTNVIINIGIV